MIASFIPFCGRCRYCAAGRSNLCDLGAKLQVGPQLDGTYRMHDEGQPVNQFLLISTFSTTGDFAVSSTDCPIKPNPLAAGTYCFVFITFTPTALGDRLGNLIVSDNGPGGSQSVPLHGTGT